MRNDLLFIDGELVDLDDNTNITLKYSSNIFTDLNKIVSNSSYTIKLPDTVRNQRVIEHADLPACNTDFQRRVHAARYFRNGIEIISKAQAVLMSVSEAFDIALIWGNKTSFASIINDGKKLTDLSYGNIENEDWALWNNKGSNSAQFPLIDYGFNSGDTNVWFHPVVTVKWILEKICIDSGILLRYPVDKLPFINKMIIPLLTRNDGERYAKSISLKLNVSHLLSTSENLVFQNVKQSNQYIKTVHKKPYAASDEYCYGCKTRVENAIFSISGNFVLNFYKVSSVPLPNKDNVFLVVWNIDGGGRSKVLRIPAKSVKQLGDYYNVSFEFANQEVPGYDYRSEIYFSVSGINNSNSEKTGNSGYINFVCWSTQIGFGKNVDGTIEDGRFYFVPNLPNIKQIDFIKAISQMLGVFAISVGDDTIQFVSVDDIIANKSKAINWTRKVIASSYKNKPKSMNYILENFAQNNRFKWKDDDTVIGNHDGNIVVNDSTIQYERDAVTLPFAASEMKDGVAYIPIYSYNQDGALNYSPGNVQPRILYLDGVKGVFTGLDWEQLISDNYSNYAKLVSNPRIITEKIEINDIDLKLLDVTVPVYLGQYGRYYAIISVKAENSGICECKLLQLEV